MKIACEFDPFCLSSFLAFRYVTRETAEWSPGVRPRWPRTTAADRIAVRDPRDILDALRGLVDAATRQANVGLLLSGGIDSAILAALLPRGTPAYTVRFDAEGALDESRAAALYAARCGLEHRVVTVTWDDVQQHLDGLMRHKRSPLHPVEAGLFLGARAAADDGVDSLLVGNGADSTFGGLDQLLSRDWTLDEFIRRYTFLDPAAALARPVPMRPVFAEYTRGGCFDSIGFLKEIHGRGIIQAFENALQAADCAAVAPYESLALAEPLDLARIRRGEPKYLLRAVFEELYPGLPPAEKIAFARPMDDWMKSWEGPRRAEFKPDLDPRRFSGEQKWLLYGLEKFMDLVDGD